jgi:hypothetical protein
LSQSPKKMVLIMTDAFKQDIFWQKASGPFWGFMILIAMWLSWAQVQAMRTQTNQLITQNGDFYFNQNDDPVPMGFYEGQRAGGINALKTFLNLPGNDGTIIYPKDAKVPFGENRLVLGLQKRVPFSALPDAVKTAVLRYKLPKPFRMVYASHYVETRGKDWTAAIREWEKENTAQHSQLVGYHQTVQSLDHMVRVQNTIIENFGKPKAVGWLRQTWNELTGDSSEKASQDAYNKDG